MNEDVSQYGTVHKKARARWENIIAGGRVKCARCGKLIDPEEPWDLGHDDFHPSRYAGPEHRRCNRATARQQPAPRTSRDW